MIFVIFLLYGAAVMALVGGAVLQAIGIAGFATLVAYLNERARARGGRWWIGLGWGRVGWRE